mmetsp:Transcript_31316/g.91323  ORF Transcript_31316/g.91323 Transcript_31316/m.91323 type:complete len:203 (+) Transcript_31316:230-838(+)
MAPWEHMPDDGKMPGHRMPAHIHMLVDLVLARLRLWSSAMVGAVIPIAMRDPVKARVAFVAGTVATTCPATTPSTRRTQASAPRGHPSAIAFVTALWALLFILLQSILGDHGDERVLAQPEDRRDGAAQHHRPKYADDPSRKPALVPGSRRLRPLQQALLMVASAPFLGRRLMLHVLHSRCCGSDESTLRRVPNAARVNLSQ